MRPASIREKSRRVFQMTTNPPPAGNLVTVRGTQLLLYFTSCGIWYVWFAFRNSIRSSLAGSKRLGGPAALDRGDRRQQSSSFAKPPYPGPLRSRGKDGPIPARPSEALSKHKILADRHAHAHADGSEPVFPAACVLPARNPPELGTAQASQYGADWRDAVLHSGQSAASYQHYRIALRPERSPGRFILPVSTVL